MPRWSSERYQHGSPSTFLITQPRVTAERMPASCTGYSCLQMFCLDSSHQWPRNKKTAHASQRLHLHPFHIIFPCLSPAGSRIALGSQCAPLPLPAMKQPGCWPGSREAGVPHTTPLPPSNQREGQLLILQKRICKKAEGGERKKITRTGREYQGRHA